MTAQQTITELSKKLAELVYNSPNPQRMLDQYLVTYGIAVSDAIVNELAAGFGNPLLITTAAVTTMLEPQLVLGPYKHTTNTINDYLENKRTIAEMAMNPTDMNIDKKLVTLPKSITGPTTERLKTLPLKNSYITLMNSRNQAQYAKNLKWALEAKSRYLALRIADTEEAKAFIYNRIKKYLSQDVGYVKWRVSSRHVSGCVCDYYLKKNVGFGPGVYPLKSAPLPVFSTHPHCRCSLVAYRKPITPSTPTTDQRPPGFSEVTPPDLITP